MKLFQEHLHNRELRRVVWYWRSNDLSMLFQLWEHTGMSRLEMFEEVSDWGACIVLWHRMDYMVVNANHQVGDVVEWLGKCDFLMFMTCGVCRHPCFLPSLHRLQCAACHHGGCMACFGMGDGPAEVYSRMQQAIRDKHTDVEACIGQWLVTKCPQCGDLGSAPASIGEELVALWQLWTGDGGKRQLAQNIMHQERMLHEFFMGRYVRDAPSLVHCAHCGKTGPTKRCGCALGPMYCDKRCQLAHWLTHKPACSTSMTRADGTLKHSASRELRIVQELFPEFFSLPGHKKGFWKQ
mmetsp:Transcript_17813/g.34821  ORF Transcript_17813/g.34821 Transcript_17813/m.34821 type:complete len:295 (+) Transcript_17813:514-1398(+)